MTRQRTYGRRMWTQAEGGGDGGRPGRDEREKKPATGGRGGKWGEKKGGEMGGKAILEKPRDPQPQDDDTPAGASGG